MEHSCEHTPLLLITGQGRSGTTVLTKAIAEHPDVFSNRVESNIIRDLLKVARHNATTESRVSQMMVDGDQFRSLFRRVILHLQFPPDEAWHSTPPKFLSTFSALDDQVAEFACEIFPRLVIIDIVRNGIEVVASRMQHRVMKQHSFEEQCLAWQAARRIVEWGQSQPNFILIRHEALLDETRCRNEFDRVLQHAGLPPSSACADYVLNTRRNRTGYEQEPEEVQRDLGRRNERWRFWTDEQLQAFERICGPNMEFFGYPIPWISAQISRPSVG